MIQMIKSFHDDTTAEVRVDGGLLEKIEVTNVLRQGCTMAPTFSSIYGSVVVERWLGRIESLNDVGIFSKMDCCFAGPPDILVKLHYIRVSLLMIWCSLLVQEKLDVLL